MQTIARGLRSPMLATIAFMLANIVWVLGIAQFVGPQLGGIFASFRHHSPSLGLEKLECPFALTQDGYGTVVAAVANPYDKSHGYTVEFFTATYQPVGYRDRPDDDQYPPYDYQEAPACTQEIRITAKQTTEVSCTVNRPDVQTDSILVIVYAYSDYDVPKGKIKWGADYESSYKGLCHIQSNWPTISKWQAHALLSSMAGLLAIGWIFAVWKYLGTITRTIVTVVGPLAWSLIALWIAIVNIYVAIVFLFVIGIFIAVVLWITRRMQDRQTKTLEYGLEQNEDKQ